MSKFAKIMASAATVTVFGSIGLFDIINEHTLLNSLRLPVELSSKALASPFKGYVPPVKRQRIERTDAAGSRGCPEGSYGSLSLLVPNDHVGLTVSKHPTFSWYASAAASTPMQFALVEPGVAQPLLVKKIKVDKPGIIQFTLPKNSKGLAQDKQYRWTVSLVCNAKRPSQSIYVRSWIERVPLAFDSQTKQFDALGTGLFYAQNGIWYDAVAAISKSYLNNPQDKLSRGYLRVLLQQVGLSHVISKEIEPLAQN